MLALPNMKSFWLFALVAFAMPNLAHALALGNLDVDSRLNQKLKAHIDLVSTQNDELLDAKAALADRAGLQRSFILASLRFEIVTKGTTSFILVSSKETILEPQLSFIVEVAAPAGHIVREYTVLLRPAVADLDRY